MSFVHKELASGRWQTFSFLQQMGNIGSEIDRAIRWKQNNEPILSQGAFERA